MKLLISSQFSLTTTFTVFCCRLRLESLNTLWQVHFLWEEIMICFSPPRKRKSLCHISRAGNGGSVMVLRVTQLLQELSAVGSVEGSCQSFSCLTLHMWNHHPELCKADQGPSIYSGTIPKVKILSHNLGVCKRKDSPSL